ncbi:MFS transporter [Alkalihalobacillus berkeleyi]|uniref:MFS transporter n=1 Tax=Pseudalkalibacillus berkeleyi TaxID=1069813 RepID=A0ABS9GUZ8_9BACL|nr:MFS transporter [Pseudalkalibacillus berkeleyi]MCF6136663.1 MFS transporter [Pseudalkalibacillus berkeleyi]
MGISNLGDWVYLIALNLMILNMTGSAAAVAGLYMLKPLASMCTSFWSGSVIDRFNKRRIMIILDVIRAMLVASIPFFSSLFIIYVIVFLINMASSFFEPTATTYITKLIPPERRKRFNSLHNLMTSGAFVIGPAIAGALVFIGSAALAIYMNALSFMLSAFVLYFLPSMDMENTTSKDNLSFKMLKEDWGVVLAYSKKAVYVMGVYALFEFALLFTAALDSTEVVFTRRVLGLSEESYGVLVSIAGVGFILGSAFVTIFVYKLKLQHLIGIGTSMTAIGYLIYALSSGFIGGSIGVFVLSFALACAHTGFITFYQNNLPVEIMGRIVSVVSVFNAILTMMFILLISMLVEIIHVKAAVITGSVLMLVVSLVLLTMTLLPRGFTYFKEKTAKAL